MRWGGGGGGHLIRHKSNLVSDRNFSISPSQHFYESLRREEKRGRRGWKKQETMLAFPKIKKERDDWWCHRPLLRQKGGMRKERAIMTHTTASHILYKNRQQFFSKIIGYNCTSCFGGRGLLHIGQDEFLFLSASLSAIPSLFHFPRHKLRSR